MAGQYKVFSRHTNPFPEVDWCVEARFVGSSEPGHRPSAATRGKEIKWWKEERVGKQVVKSKNMLEVSLRAKIELVVPCHRISDGSGVAAHRSSQD